ncbi:MAG: GTP cyclohydrolase I FolE [Ginsengibacter sp.]|jgi:GTP cyclohydrolase I
MDINGVTLLQEQNIKMFNNHFPIENPVKDDAFDIDDNLKIELISEKFREIMDILGLDLNDDSLNDTPNRVAKMYVNEIFRGLNPKNKPAVTLFENTYGYHTPLIELNIPFTSFCEHHFVPIQGKANVAYIPHNHVIGLSKIHRLIDFYARRPQVQERLTMQIQQELSAALKTQDIGVVLKASHSCISCRGVEDSGSCTITSSFTGMVKADKELISLLMRFS